MEVTMDRISREVGVLSELLDVTLDSVAGYREAAAQSGNPGLRHCFLRRADKRLHVAEHLTAIMERLGGGLPVQGSALETAHHAFLRLRRRFAGSDAAMLRELVRGERFLRSCYEDVLGDNVLSPRAHDALRTAYGSVWRGGLDAVDSAMHLPAARLM
jgi:uncharacterized protein (TIGR02284 family)